MNSGNCVDTNIREFSPMVYVAGIFGFVCGFFAGQMLLLFLLRDYSKKEILEMLRQPGKKFKYGLLNWGIATANALFFIYLYNNYLASH